MQSRISVDGHCLHIQKHGEMPMALVACGSPRTAAADVVPVHPWLKPEHTSDGAPAPPQAG